MERLCQHERVSTSDALSSTAQSLLESCWSRSSRTCITFAPPTQRVHDIGLLQPNSGAHLIRAAALIYNLPHTSLGLGPSVTYQHGLHYRIGAVVHF